MHKKGKLSILLVTYNHERHIREAINSIIAQKKPETISEIEVIVCDDASEDGTLACIKDFVGLADHVRFRYLPPQANLGITRNYQRGFAACDGDYIAVLEGDDYWTDDQKLIQQVAVMEQNQSCVLCATNYLVRDESNGKERNRIDATQGWQRITVPDLISDNVIGNFSTCMYRREVIQKLPPQLFEIKSYDWIVNICAGTQGEIIFLNKPMSVYRLHADGAWSSMHISGKLKSQLAALVSYDALTNHRFQGEFKLLEKKLNDQIFEIDTYGTLGPKKKGPLSRTWRRIKSQLKNHP